MLVTRDGHLMWFSSLVQFSGPSPQVLHRCPRFCAVSPPPGTHSEEEVGKPMVLLLMGCLQEEAGCGAQSVHTTSVGLIWLSKVSNNYFQNLCF